jgi:hypothetical protein
MVNHRRWLMMRPVSINSEAGGVPGVAKLLWEFLFDKAADGWKNEY